MRDAPLKTCQRIEYTELSVGLDTYIHIMYLFKTKHKTKKKLESTDMDFTFLNLELYGHVIKLQLIYKTNSTHS